MQLAIDTSTDTASLALLKEGHLLAEVTWRCRQNHTVQLLPHLSQLLDQAGLEIQSIVAVIVARGPGSFNGLRVGLGTAKGLALSLKIPLVGISTLEAEAYQHAETGRPICPIFKAGGGEIATAIYQRKGGQWCQLVAEHITTIESLCSKITTRTLFCGEFAETIAKELSNRLGARAIIPPLATRLRRAGYLAELGLRRLEAGDYDNPASLQPLYLRRPAITKPKRRIQIGAEGNTKAVIWDMDGVMVDSAPYHLKAWQEAFKKRGINFSQEDFRKTFGQRNDTIIRAILGREAGRREIEAIGREKEASFRQKIGREVTALPGVVALMQSLKASSFRMAVASSAPLENIELIMRGLGVTDCCQVIISEKDVTRGKPDPQAFLLAATRLGVRPENCLVIEDAVAGVAAAKRAGMACIAISNSHPAQSLAPADLVVDSLKKVSAKEIEGLINKKRG